MREAVAHFHFDHHIDFHSEDSDALLRSIPAAPGVFALRGANTPDGVPSEPYLTRTADLRRRLRRLLAPSEASSATAPDSLDSPPPVLSKRLNLRNKVRFIDYTRTGSGFESTLLLYRASRAAFGPEEARRRLRLHTPFFLRITMQHEHPRVYVTNRLGKKSLAETFGPFPSRAAAERYCDAVLDLFQLRRCHEDLQPYPDHPGCVYGDIHKCMAPCKEGNPQACTPAQYAAEAQRVFAFFGTRGESLLTQIAQQREAASASLDFEAAAALHKHWEKVRAAALLADQLIRPVSALRAIILQPSAPREAADSPNVSPISTEATAEPSQNLVISTEATAETAQNTVISTGGAAEVERPAVAATADAAVFLLESGRLTGPERLSTLGVRAVREQTAVGSSLFAQPLMLAPIPLNEPATPSPHEAVILSEEQRDESKDPGPASSAPTPQPFSTSNPNSTSALSPEDRARAVLDHLHQQATTQPAPTLDDLCDALSLFRRWYYRPEKQRTGEVFLPGTSLTGQAGAWPIRRILNGAARLVLGPPAQLDAVNREAAREARNDLKTKVIHPGREGVERVVLVLPKRSRSRKAITPADLSS